MTARTFALSVNSTFGTKLLHRACSASWRAPSTSSSASSVWAGCSPRTSQVIWWFWRRISSPGRSASLAAIAFCPGDLLCGAGFDQVWRPPLWRRPGTARCSPCWPLQFVLLVSFLAVWVAAGSELDPATPTGVVVGMLGVGAMAVQNALVRILIEAPATAVMTTDITTFMMDVGAMVFRRDPKGVAYARSRAGRTWPAIVGFTLRLCSLGALLEAVIGPWSLALPISFAFLALALGLSVKSGV